MQFRSFWSASRWPWKAPQNSPTLASRLRDSAMIVRVCTECGMTSENTYYGSAISCGFFGVCRYCFLASPPRSAFLLLRSSVVLVMLRFSDSPFSLPLRSHPAALLCFSASAFLPPRLSASALLLFRVSAFELSTFVFLVSSCCACLLRRFSVRSASALLQLVCFAWLPVFSPSHRLLLL